MRVLVTGGAGYIGSHTALELISSGHQVVIVDNFINSKPAIIPRLELLSGEKITHYDVDLADKNKIDQIFSQPIDAVIHFAGLKAVGESVAIPGEYYRNNLESTLVLLAALKKHQVKRFVFSSSATVYGEKAPIPYQEDFKPLQAASPYGNTKVMIEQILTDIAAADKEFNVALLRYFNPTGAHASGLIGEDPQGIPNNLMPFISQVAVGRREKLSIYGNDYPTRDGTCERDYIHVTDLAKGHVAALEHIDALSDNVRVFNLGSGQGTSVLELFHAFEHAIGRELPYEFAPRRAGDLAAFWADPSRAKEELGWSTEKTIEDMCVDTWRWQQKNPQGFVS